MVGWDPMKEICTLKTGVRRDIRLTDCSQTIKSQKGKRASNTTLIATKYFRLACMKIFRYNAVRLKPSA